MMILTKFSYFGCEKAEYWEIQDVVLDKVTIIVGKNAAGKTRMVFALRNLVVQICGLTSTLFDGTWDLSFVKPDCTTYRYYIKIMSNKVVEENFYINGNKVLDRQLNCRAFGNVADKKKLMFIPTNRLTLQVCRGTKQFPYLEELLTWADNYNTYFFSICCLSNLVVKEPAYTEKIESLYIIAQFLAKMSKEQLQIIAQDMRKIGYCLDDIIVSYQTQGFCIVPQVKVHEEDQPFFTFQEEMSSGMYRALAVITLVRWLIFDQKQHTLVIDDIGAGLDFEKAPRLVRWLLDSIKDSKIQIILTTSERHVLNVIDVVYWNILEQHGNKVTVYNYQNSKQAFDDFSMTGLSNFDLFKTEIYKVQN